MEADAVGCNELCRLLILMSLLYIRPDLFGSAQYYPDTAFGNPSQLLEQRKGGLSHWLDADMRTIVLYRRLTLNILARTLHR